jgi:hypothetical protein
MDHIHKVLIGIAVRDQVDESEIALPKIAYQIVDRLG